MKDYFNILQIPENATPDEIRQAYRKLAKFYHPDVNKSAGAHEKFCEISEAYEFLIKHWFPRSGAQYKKEFHQPFSEFEQTDGYRQFQQEAQERARKHAKMRYEKFRKQHEAFQESGINDLVLLLTVCMRIFSLVLFIFLFFTPLVLAIIVHWSWILSILLMWPFATGIAWYYYDNRINYFIPGKFYYTFRKIRKMYTDTFPTVEECYFCKGKMADSKPFKIELYKLKDIKLGSEGARQHNVNYISETYPLIIPRSHKAFIVHTVIAFSKIFCITGFMIFFNIHSIVWCAIAGFIAGGILSQLILAIFRTRSNTSYLFTISFFCRLLIWIFAITLASRFYLNPPDIVSTDSIQFVIVAIILFDSFLMQLINLILGKHSGAMLFRQYQPLKDKINEGYSIYNDIPVISVVYPLFRWITG
jgi:hypothetical protein